MRSSGAFVVSMQITTNRASFPKTQAFSRNSPRTQRNSPSCARPSRKPCKAVRVQTALHHAPCSQNAPTGSVGPFPGKFPDVSPDNLHRIRQSSANHRELRLEIQANRRNPPQSSSNLAQSRTEPHESRPNLAQSPVNLQRTSYQISYNRQSNPLRTPSKPQELAQTCNGPKTTLSALSR